MARLCRECGVWNGKQELAGLMQDVTLYKVLPVEHEQKVVKSGFSCIIFIILDSPLIGLFKNERSRENGRHLELFYMCVFCFISIFLSFSNRILKAKLCWLRVW